jgi:hypothetical protein
MIKPVTEKRCTGCSGWLPLEEFPHNRHMHLGRSSRCRECHRAATRDWRDRNRDRVNAANVGLRIAKRIRGSSVTVFSVAVRSRVDRMRWSAVPSAAVSARSSSVADLANRPHQPD